MSSRDETWHASAFPWTITNSSTIASGRVVTIDPGSTIQFGSGASLVVQGQLSAVGTSASPITFTSSEATPTRGSWSRIEFQGGTNPASQISYATVSYGGTNGYEVHIVNGTVNFDHVTVTQSATKRISSEMSATANLSFVTASNCASHGMLIAGGATPGTNTITDSTFANNGGWGLYVDTNGQATVHHTSFTGNTNGGLTSVNTLIDATICYWANATGPSSSGFGTGQAVSTNVKFEPWLGTAPTIVQRFLTSAVQNRRFNPAISSVSKLNATTNNAATWTLTITSSANTVVRTFTGTGTDVVTVWDGNDGSGNPQPSGTYAYEVQSTTGTDSAAPLRGREIIDPTMQPLRGFAAAPVYFSPNGDGVKETTSVSGTSDFDDDTWTVQLKDQNGVVVQSAMGLGAIAYTWNGQNGSGVLQPDATYTAQVVVTEGTATATGTVNVTLDTTAPVATITAPVSAQTVSNVYQNASADVRVVGTITDANLTNWTVDDSSAATPNTWTTLASGTTPVSNGQLALWQTLPLTNGQYNLRLRGSDQAGNTATTTVTPVIGNFKISQNPYEFNAGANATVTYTSTVPFPLTETLTLKNEMGAAVRTLVNAQRSSGNFSDQWNGRNDAGALVPDGGYAYTASVTDGVHTMAWDTSNQMRSTNLTAKYPPSSATFDPFNNKPIRVNYWLSDSSRTAIEVGPPGYAYGTDCAWLNATYGTVCLTQWKYEASGSHSFSWWGTNADGSFLPNKPGMNIIERQDNFPQNVVIVFGTAPTIASESATPALFNPGAAVPPVNSPAAGTQAITFTLGTYQNQPASITVSVFNQASRSVLRTITVPSQAAGAVTVNWDGRADNGLWVAPGYYTLIVSVTDSIGNTTAQHLVTTIEY